jgi:hypothetical protein
MGDVGGGGGIGCGDINILSSPGSSLFIVVVVVVPGISGRLTSTDKLGLID